MSTLLSNFFLPLSSFFVEETLQTCYTSTFLSVNGTSEENCVTKPYDVLLYNVENPLVLISYWCMMLLNNLCN